ncbi:hypothetical protein AB833_21690 [Chromatiales bacterium (ex Bugula neritina AB1)]|nr:hypothetical protein AB833_21690 [Chromatiales bacterium (ex Bugula neritina AB1)]
MSSSSSKSETIQIFISVLALLATVAALLATYQANQISKSQIEKQEIAEVSVQIMESLREAVRMLYEAEALRQSPNNTEEKPYVMRLRQLGTYNANIAAAGLLSIDKNKRSQHCLYTKVNLDYFYEYVEANWPSMFETDYPSLKEYRETLACD